MIDEIRTIYLDSDLDVEAYRFKGIMHKFPAHFHDYYVIGFIEAGQLALVCKSQQYIVNSGDLVLFNPYDTHSCEQLDGKTLDYRSINVKPDVMKKIAIEITGNENLPFFKQSVVYQSELVFNLKELHLKISQDETQLKKEELFLYFMEELIETYSDQTNQLQLAETSFEIKTMCTYLDENYTKQITLNDLSQLTGWSKFHLLRSFTKEMGISPYSYLETIRINHAKKLLEQGLKPIEVAFLTGFSDQSHLTKFFKRQIGLTPKQYMRIYLNT
ncbi:AraC family transcriptional regulator [Paenibacillus sp. GSMTC-2017]|uniref:helix-turn-helix domain-containing protein n=1 Tax=Paenibacillus sp. GSMTC-2017 TaxID=2794350 RepID=UPI0018D67D53|nr:AraC family transcriptional regulator [Paenibacillus sp. GSMTC-2017]MBH5316212.1 AraC family transcriptional regulator [Paenibacillus sp. GSMTC-2017]